MKLGAEPKKIAALVGLLVVALVVFYMNSSPTEETVYPSAAPTAAAPLSQIPNGPATTAAKPRARATTEFRPSVRPKRGEVRPDPMTIDPTLRLDILAKLQNVTVEGTRRSVFDFTQPPPPKVDPVKIAMAKPGVPNPIVPVQPVKPVDQASVAPPKPQAPPIPLKFYGYISPRDTSKGAKRAFFMEGEEIFVANEGETVKKRYKIVRIGVNSAVVEDTQFGSQQTLPLEEQPG